MYEDLSECRTHGQNTQLCGIKPVRVDTIYHAFLRLHYNLLHTPEILAYYLKQPHAIRKGQMLWGMDIVGLNTRISEILNQTHTLTMLNKQGLVDPDMMRIRHGTRTWYRRYLRMNDTWEQIDSQRSSIRICSAE